MDNIARLEAAATAAATTHAEAMAAAVAHAAAAAAPRPVEPEREPAMAIVNRPTGGQIRHLQELSGLSRADYKAVQVCSQPTQYGVKLTVITSDPSATWWSSPISIGPRISVAKTLRT